MKHTIPVTLIIILIFFLSQVIGLYALGANIMGVTQTPGGETIVEHADTTIGERPEMQGPETFLYMICAILVGTGLILLLVKFKKFGIWKAMFFFAVWMTCSITLGVFIDPLIALVFCIFLAFVKVYRPNIWIHNLTELLIYPGIAVIFVPLLDLPWVIALLLAISAYDVFAVWKSKHMVSMAQFQTKSRAFAGVFVTYKLKTQKSISKAAKTVKGRKAKTAAKGRTVAAKEDVEYRNAILGGGDIAFPLIFAGVVMDSLIKMSIAKTTAFLLALIIPVVVAIALFSLLAMAKKDRFYPAMPFITAGCLAGYGILWLLISGIIA
ncbi:MAG: presenilin family intramembrane aspartyl protease [Candidatus Aenigmatarchaeota archaeon]